MYHLTSQVSVGGKTCSTRTAATGVPRARDPIGGERSPSNAPNPLKGDESVGCDDISSKSKLPPSTGRFASLTASCLMAPGREKAESSSTVPESCTYAHGSLVARPVEFGRCSQLSTQATDRGFLEVTRALFQDQVWW